MKENVRNIKYNDKKDKLVKIIKILEKIVGM